MHWVIDGYNVIRRDPELRSREAQSLEAGRRALLHVVVRLARTIPQDDFTIVFDGARMADVMPPPGRVGIRFSRPPETADDLVIRLARRWTVGAVVVTSDRAVQQAAERARAAVVGAEAFLTRATHVADRNDENAPRVKQDDEGEDTRSLKRGNPRRASKKARAAARALKRLRPR